MQTASLAVDHQLAALSTDTPPDQLWRFRLLKSEIFIWQGFPADAVNLLRLDPSFTLPREQAAYRSALLGSAYMNLQDIPRAATAYEEAQTLNLPEKREITCRILLGQGRLAVLSGDNAAAEHLFHKAADIAHGEQQSILEANAMGNIGMLKMLEHQYAEAVDWFNASLALAASFKAEATKIRATGNLGWAYLKMGDLDRAAENFTSAEALSRARGMVTDQETWRMNTAAVQLLQGDVLAAQQSYEESIKLARRLDDRQEIIYGLHGLTNLALLHHDLASADLFNKEAASLALALNNSESIRYGILDRAKIDILIGQASSARLALERISGSHDSENTLRADAFGTLAQLEDHDGHLVSAARCYRSAIALLDQTRDSLGREEFQLSYPTNSKAIYDDFISFLMDHNRPNEAFAEAEHHRARTLIEGLAAEHHNHAPSITVAETLLGTKGSDRVILSYWLAPHHSYVWIFSSHGMESARLPDEAFIHKRLEQFRHNQIDAFHSLSVIDPVGQELFTMLVGPAAHLLRSGSRVTIIPDGILCGLNFETLPVNSPYPHYWIEDVVITNASSAALLSPRPSKPLSPGSNTLLLIGNPQTPSTYQPLTHASEEMKLIQQHFEPSRTTLLSDSDATPAAYFRAQPNTYDLIHFVAHGTASRLSPLDSAIVLSRDSTSYNLYARDIMKVHLRARLVTISSCDSAGTRIYPSEGLVGLSWAFLRAGARQVVAALWDVNDASTSRLMGSFYENLSKGQQAADALRNAKLALLRSNSVYNRPFYWAPFMIYEGI